MDNENDFTAGIDGFEDFDEIYASIFGEQEALRKSGNTDEALNPPEDTPAEEVLPEPPEYQAEAAVTEPLAEEAEADVDQHFEEASDDTPPVPEDAAEDEPEFDYRFHLDRNTEDKRKDFSYNGKRVSSTQDLHYEPKQQAEYEELKSSYTTPASFDAL